MASSKKSRQKSPPAEPVPADRKPSAILRVLKSVWRPFPLLLMAVSLSCVMFWPEIVQRVPNLRDRPEYQLPWSELSVTSPGRWVPQTIVSEVQQRSGLPDPLPVLDEDIVEQLAVAFAQHPWILDVRSVEKRSPGCIRVEVTYRQPVIMVRNNRGYYPVDQGGVLLPPSDFAIADTERFPVVEGVRSIPAGPAGTQWGDEAVHGAARLAELLIRKEDWTSPWEKFGMTSIRVVLPDRPAKSLEDVTLGLTIQGGSEVVWGRPPGADSLEPTVQQKLLRLQKFLPDRGSATESVPAMEIDIRQWDVIKQQELTRNPDDRGQWQ